MMKLIAKSGLVGLVVCASLFTAPVSEAVITSCCFGCLGTRGACVRACGMNPSCLDACDANYSVCSDRCARFYQQYCPA